MSYFKIEIFSLGDLLFIRFMFLPTIKYKKLHLKIELVCILVKLDNRLYEIKRIMLFRHPKKIIHTSNFIILYGFYKFNQLLESYWTI